METKCRQTKLVRFVGKLIGTLGQVGLLPFAKPVSGRNGELQRVRSLRTKPTPNNAAFFGGLKMKRRKVSLGKRAHIAGKRGLEE